MKVIIVKELGTDSLVPLTLSENDNVEMLRHQWSAASGHDSLDYFFQSNGVFIEDDLLIRDLPMVAAGSSCVEVLAERSIQLHLRPYGLVGRDLELKVPLSLKVSILSAAIFNALQISERPVDFFRSSLCNGEKEQCLQPELSLGDQGVSENEAITAVLHLGIIVDTQRHWCDAKLPLSSLFDPKLPPDIQRLRCGEQVLDSACEAMAVLPEAADSLKPVKLTLEWALTVKLTRGDLNAVVEVAAWCDSTVGQVFAASSWGQEGDEMVLWREEAELDPSTTLRGLPDAAPGCALDLTVDTALSLRVPTSDDLQRIVRVRRGARVSHLAYLVATGEPDTAFSLATQSGLTLEPNATVQQYALDQNALLCVRRPELEVLFEFEKQAPVAYRVPKEASFRRLLDKAATALRLTFPSQVKIEFRCGCGRVVRQSDPKCNTLATGCCRRTPRRLRVCRFLKVRVSRMFAPELSLLNEHFESTATVGEVQQAILKHAKGSLEDSEWRLCHKERLLSDSKPLFELAPSFQDLALELESQIALCLCVGSDGGAGGRSSLWRAWPNSTTDSLLAEIRTAGLVDRNQRHVMLLRGRELPLRTKDDKWISLWTNGLRSGSELHLVVPNQATSENGTVESSFEEETEDEAMTTMRVICRNWGMPDFERTFTPPVSIRDIRTVVAEHFNVALRKVSLLQHRAKLANGTQLIDIGNYRWSDVSGNLYPSDACASIYKYTLEQNHELLPIPGSHRWKVFVRHIDC